MPGPDGTIAKIDGEIDRAPGANQPLYSMCGVMLEKSDEQLTKWLMQGRAKEMRSLLCIEHLKTCNQTEHTPSTHGAQTEL